MSDDLNDLKVGVFDVKNRKTVTLGSIQIYKGDAEMFQKIQDYLGCSKSEVIRSAIRIMATQLPLPR